MGPNSNYGVASTYLYYSKELQFFYYNEILSKKYFFFIHSIISWVFLCFANSIFLDFASVNVCFFPASWYWFRYTKRHLKQTDFAWHILDIQRFKTTLSESLDCPLILLKNGQIVRQMRPCRTIKTTLSYHWNHLFWRGEAKQEAGERFLSP